MIDKIYPPEEISQLIDRIVAMATNAELSDVEMWAFFTALNKFGADVEKILDTHDKLGKLSINFDV